MAELIVVGPGQSMKSQRLLEPGVAVRIGRAPGPHVWSIPWENRLSRSPSIEMELEEDGLRVHCLESARNGFSFDGVLVREAHLQGGDSFQVGETSFQFVDFLKESRVADEIRVFGEDELRTMVGDNKTHHIEALAEVPGLMIESSTDQVLAERLVDLSNWREAMSCKSESLDWNRFVAHVNADHLPHSVIVDCTASDEVAAQYVDWFEQGIHVVTPNKKGQSSSLRHYDQIQAARRDHNVHFLYEPSVGAALPMIIFF